MPKVPEGKKGLYIYLDEAVYEALMSLIKRKYEGLHGVLSAEVQHAIAHWIKQHESTLTQTTHKINPAIPRSHVVANAIINRLRNAGFYNQCAKRDLIKAIEDERGSDPRTVEKWMKFLVRNGYLKWLNPNVLEVL
jgi:hypothetical protein